MCGIVGAIGNLEGQALIDILLETEARGKDATGFWFPSTGIVKDGKKASDFIPIHKNTILENATTNKVFVGHCRLATHGKVEDNVNNHPLESEHWIMVHNGVVRLQEVEGYQYKTETDSEAILSYIETYGVEKGLENVGGGDSAAIILVKKDEPNSLFLWRAGSSPMALVYMEGRKCILIGSTTGLLSSSLTEDTAGPLSNLFKKKFKDFLSVFELPTRELWKLSVDGDGNLSSCKIADTKYVSVPFRQEAKIVGRSISSYTTDSYPVSRWNPWSYSEEAWESAWAQRNPIQQTDNISKSPSYKGKHGVICTPRFGRLSPGDFVDVILTDIDIENLKKKEQYHYQPVKLLSGNLERLNSEILPMGKVLEVIPFNQTVRYKVATDDGLVMEVAAYKLEKIEVGTPACYGFIDSKDGECTKCIFSLFCAGDAYNVQKAVDTVVKETAYVISKSA